MATRLIKKTYNEIWEEVKTKFAENAIAYGLDPTLELTSEVGLILAFLAYDMRTDVTTTNYAFRQNLVLEAEGENLDFIGANYNTERNESQPSFCTLEFTFTSPLPVQNLIPKGTRVRTTDGVLSFATDIDTLCNIGTNSVQIEATATTAGSLGNEYGIGDVSNLEDNIPFVNEVSNINTTFGGADEETDARYRKRIQLSYSNPSTAGAKNSVKFWSYTYNNEIIDCEVIGADDGLGALPGEIWIYPLLKTGIPTASFLASMQDYMRQEDIRPLCVTVFVKEITAVYKKSMLTVYYRPNFDLDILKDKVDEALSNYSTYLRQQIGTDLKQSQLMSVLMQIEGIKDVSLGGFADYTAKKNEVVYFSIMTKTFILDETL